VQTDPADFLGSATITRKLQSEEKEIKELEKMLEQ